MDIAITKMSSKGQIVIPAEMRKHIREGEKLVVIQTEDRLIMKKASKLSKNLEEDLAFAKRTEEAFRRISEGKGVRMDFDDFLETLKKW